MLRDTKKVAQYISYGPFGRFEFVVPQFDLLGRYDHFPINMMIARRWNLRNDITFVDKSP
jgi:hypothetical protein